MVHSKFCKVPLTIITIIYGIIINIVSFLRHFLDNPEVSIIYWAKNSLAYLDYFNSARSFCYKYAGNSTIFNTNSFL